MCTIPSFLSAHTPSLTLGTVDLVCFPTMQWVQELGGSKVDAFRMAQFCQVIFSMVVSMAQMSMPDVECGSMVGQKCAFH